MVVQNPDQLTSRPLPTAVNPWPAGGPSRVLRRLARRAANLRRTDRPFDLERWFALVSLVCISLICATLGLLMSRFLSETMIRRDAVVSMEMIASVVEVEDTAAYFARHSDSTGRKVLDSFFNHVARLPDIARAHVYAADRTIIWSSDPLLIGQKAGFNPELDETLDGELEIEWGHVGELDKPEHADFDRQQQGTRFVEAYIPIWTRDKTQVIGVVEIYRLPHALFAAIDAGNRLIWTGAAVGGAFLYGALFWIVRRASRVMREQQRRLVDTETMAAVGEMASAVAHGIRNPLAVIRSSAELALGEQLRGAHEAAADIVAETDRLDHWVRDFLSYARSDDTTPEPVDINEVLQQCLAGFGPTLQRQKISLETDLAESLPRAEGNSAPLAQVINTLISNSLEAMPEGGRLRASTRWDPREGRITLEIGDSGFGIDAAHLKDVFRPFFTTKPTGTGLGLPLAQRLLARCGGAIDLTSEQGVGTTATLRLRTAR